MALDDPDRAGPARRIAVPLARRKGGKRIGVAVIRALVCALVRPAEGDDVEVVKERPHPSHGRHTGEGEYRLGVLEALGIEVAQERFRGEAVAWAKGREAAEAA